MIEKLRRFRRHRSLLVDSMETLIEVGSRAELIERLQCKAVPVDWSKLVIEPYFMDPDQRIGWPETWIVHIPGGGVFGFTDGPLS